MSKKIALITTQKGVVSGVTVFMELMQRELMTRGYQADLLRPVPHSFTEIGTISSILSYGLLREELKSYDLAMGNGIGLTGAVDLPITLIDNIHSTSSGANEALEKAYQNMDESERTWMDYVMDKLMGQVANDIPQALATKRNSFDVDRIVAQHSQEIITVSPANRDEVIKYFEVPEERISVVPNGIEKYWSQDRKIVQDISSHPLNVVYTGRAGYTTINMFLKGIDRILAVLGAVTDAQPIALFHLAKEDKQAVYSQMLNERGIRHYYNVENKDLAHYLRAGDIYIHTSRYESCSLSLMEAMASGLVPVSFPAGMASIQIQDGINGFIVTSISEMSARIQQLTADPTLRARLSANAAETIRTHYSVDKMLNGYLTSFERLLT